LADAEQVLVTAISGNSLTVSRGLNGTTAASHSSGAQVRVLRWRAAVINTARIWSRAPVFEPFYVDADMDTDVRLLLEGYVRRG
jgi:hypothetical protein